MFNAIAFDESALLQNLVDELNVERPPAAYSPYKWLPADLNVSYDTVADKFINYGGMEISGKDIYFALGKMAKDISKISGDISSTKLKDYKTQTSVFK